MVQQNAGIVEKEIGSEEASFIGWSSFLNYLSKDSVSLSDKGTLFEKVCKKLLLTAPFFNGEVKEVWRWADWPGNGGLHDIGIDLVVLETSGTYMAVQSKFYDANASISKADIDSFLSAGARSYTDPKTGESIVFSTLLIMSTTGNVSANAKAVCVDHHPYVVFFGPEELRTCGIDWLHFDIQDIEGMKASEKKTLRKHQSKALEQVLAGFANHDRGKMIMACGTGKTFTSLKIVENYIEKKHLNNPTILYLVPSIALLSQTVLEWKSQFGLKQGNDMLAVCSDATAANVSRKSEVEDGDLTNIPIPATTSVSFVKKAYDKIQNDGKVHFFFSTYQSIDVIHKVQEECHIVFDMVVCDEAHRTIGAYLSSDDNAEDRSDFTKIHDNKYIPAKKRLYMTATEKIFGTGAKNKASNAGYEVYSMDDESVFGPTFYSLSFGQAVEQDLLSDYRLVVLQVKESQVTSLFLPGEGGTIDENARIVGSLAALSKKSLIKEANDFSTDPEPMKRAVVFCSRIKESEQISKLYNSLIEPEFLGRDYFEKNGFVIPDSQSISGLDNSDVKMKKLNWLRDQVPGKTCRMLVNARCLSEGVDVPTLDAVVFMAKKRSQVDIIQAVGRVMRKVGTGAQKKYGYIILPVVIKDEQLTDKTLDSNDDFRVVWQVVQALRSHDERFDVQINKFGFTKELPPNIIVTDAFVPPRSSKKDGQYVDRTEVVEGTDDDFNGREMVQTTLPLPDPEDIKKNEGLFAAALVRHCGNRLYWDDWSKNIGDVTNHCAIEIQKLVTENPSCKKEFAKFERGLKDILNPYITDEDAVSMLAEHMVTLPVFTALFSNVDFVSQNVVTKIMQSMINKLYDAGLSRETDKLKDFYDSVKEQVSGIDSSESKQALVKKLYEKFFQHALPMAQTKFGIVYTPTEIVDFIINSVESVLKSEFKESLSAPGVKILDPFTGTGTFIIELLKKLKEEGIDKEQLLSKYQNDIWCNEIMLLAYYIALINIEDVFGGYYGSFVPFQHAVLTDTFQMAERGHSKDVTALVEDEEFAKASAKEKEEAASEIRVIIANPPYSVGQRNANDNNANNKYASIDEAIAKTYLSGVKVTNVNSLYDSYVRSFRWASDRISKKGVVAYVSNGSFIDNLAFSGFRASLLKEFQHVYVFNLRGNCRTQGLARQKEKGNVFGEGSRTTIAITILVKNEGSKFDGFVHYHDIGDYLSREDKLDIVKKTNDISAIKWEKLYPDTDNDWLNQKSDEFANYLPLGDKKGSSDPVFAGLYTRGIMTGKDGWLYGFDVHYVKEKVDSFIGFYNLERKRFKESRPLCKNADDLSKNAFDFVEKDPLKIKWDRELIYRLVRNDDIDSSYEVPTVLFRPFIKMELARSRDLIQMNYLWDSIFPNGASTNLCIAISAPPLSQAFSVLISNSIVDLHCLQQAQVFPLYWYTKKDGQTSIFDEDNSSDYTKDYAITDVAQNDFREAYSDPAITKDDIFYYVYGLLHSEEYKKKFANNLAKEFPRVPFLKGFYEYIKAGKSLAFLHLNYESVEPYKGVLIKKSRDDYSVLKIRFVNKEDKTSIRFNDYIIIEGVPLEAYSYKLNGRSPIEWVMDQYQYSVDPETKIVCDPNKYSPKGGKYIFDLLLSLITVSLETQKIVASLPQYEEIDESQSL